MERVTVLQGNKNSNVLVVAPHGPDDQNTGLICEAIQNLIDCYMVVNNGFQRSQKVDSLNDLANCNSTDHCINDSVVFGEFTKPIINFCKRKPGPCYSMIYYIHGMGSQIQEDFILGFGQGAVSDRLTMNINRADLLKQSIESVGYNVAFATPGGPYSARKTDNLTQLFRTSKFGYASKYVECVQIEISNRVRSNPAKLALNIASVLEKTAESVVRA